MQSATTARTLADAIEQLAEPRIVEFRESFQRWKPCTPEELLEERHKFPDDDGHGSFVRSYLAGIASSRSGDYARARAELLRLLRATSSTRPLRYWVRAALVNVLIRMGDLDRAERMVRRELGRVTFAALDPSTQTSIITELGRAYRRKGWLTLASDVYRQAVRLRPPGSWDWLASMANLAHIELRADRLESVRSIISEITAAVAGPVPDRARWNAACCQLSLAVELESPAEGEFHLERLRALRRGSEPVRDELLFRNYEADVLRIQRRFAEAANHYQAALDAPEAGRFTHDLVPNLRCGLAECLHGMREYPRALREASEAARLGAEGDRMDELTGVRLQGLCLWELGRHEEARALFIRAEALHVGRQFVREQARLKATVQALDALHGHSTWSDSPPRQPTRVVRAASTVERVPLQDGREYVTLDPAFERMLRRAAMSDLPVLIDGETGTGKELAARLIHDLGPRSARPFVVVDCSTLPEPMLEYELFGAQHGAFSESSRGREGIVAQADGGTLLLDELPELSLRSQSKMLRLLQESTYRRLGDPMVRRVHIRFIAATNRPLEEMLQRRQLKPDLFHRLNGHRIHLRPLRERREEIPVLAARFLAAAGAEGIDDDGLLLLERAPWNGNVRELEMVIRAAALGLPRGELMGVRHLRDVLPPQNIHQAGISLRARRLAAERSALQDALDAHGGNVSAAAREMGMSRQAFYKALERSGGRGRA